MCLVILITMLLHTFSEHILTTLVSSCTTRSMHFMLGSFILLICFFTIASKAMSGVKRPTLIPGEQMLFKISRTQTIFYVFLDVFNVSPTILLHIMIKYNSSLICQYALFYIIRDFKAMKYNSIKNINPIYLICLQDLLYIII